LVTFVAKVDASEIGLSGVHYDHMEELSESFGSAAESFTSSGGFMSVLSSSLRELPAGTVDVLSSVTLASITDIKFVGVYLDRDSEVLTVIHASSSSESTEGITDSMSGLSTLAQFQRSVIVVCVCVMVLVVAFFMVTASKSKTFEKEYAAVDKSADSVTESTREVEIDNILIPEKTPNLD
jgi:hypothetical protein